MCLLPFLSVLCNSVISNLSWQYFCIKRVLLMANSQKFCAVFKLHFISPSIWQLVSIITVEYLYFIFSIYTIISNDYLNLKVLLCGDKIFEKFNYYSNPSYTVISLQNKTIKYTVSFTSMICNG